MSNRRLRHAWHQCCCACPCRECNHRERLYRLDLMTVRMEQAQQNFKAQHAYVSHVNFNGTKILLVVLIIRIIFPHVMLDKCSVLLMYLCIRTLRKMCSYQCRIIQYKNWEYNKSSRLASIIAKPDQWQQMLTSVVHVPTVFYTVMSL
jgi:hypothetical protein